MKQIKVFAFPTHCTKDITPGVDFARIIQPMRELQKDPRFKVTIFDNTQSKDKLAKFDWRDVAQEYDILYINYLTLAWDYAMIGMLFRKYNKKIVLDIDDLIWEIQEDNSSYSTYKPGSEGRAIVTDIINEVDYVTTTNNYLKNALISYTKKTDDRVMVFPNRIDFDLYKWRAKPVKKSAIRIGYFGSSSHFNDLSSRNFTEALTRLMSEYPNLEIVTIGAMMGNMKKAFGQRYFTDYGHQDLYTWVGLMPEKLREVDIYAVPLENTTYNKCKSSIKFIEMGSTCKPGCWQRVRQYMEVVEDGVNGYLCDSIDSWYKNLKALIDSPELREKMGQEAFKTVEKDWQAKDHTVDYAKFFTKIMEEV